MRTAKWICRYVFFALLLAMCLGWCGYCISVVSEINATIHSMEYVDLAVQHSPKVLELLDRLEQFKGLRNTAFIVTGCVLLCLTALILTHVFSGKHPVKKSKLVKKAAAAVPQQAPAAPAQTVFTEPVPPQAAAPVSAPQITEAPTAEAPVQEPQKPAGGYCDNCGQYYEEYPAFCVKCGHKLK